MKTASRPCCTPTATPPKWLVDTMPDMITTGKDGRARSFGSRRHYSFAHQGYRRECARITRLVAGRFGTHPAVIGWQTDNEYGCRRHDHFHGAADLVAFRDWLAQRYQSADALNRSWGNVFWSMQYRGFDEVELPNLTVTEANPAHWMDYRRFASRMVAEFNQLQVDILRELSPGRISSITSWAGFWISTISNSAGSQDVSSWDSILSASSTRCATCSAMTTGLPSPAPATPTSRRSTMILYRATSSGRWWIMEQQPGPVNWALNNIAPVMA